MPFNLIQASDILRIKYKAQYIIPYATQNALEAQGIPYDVGQKHLRIDIVANATSLTPMRIGLVVFKVSATPEYPEYIHTEDETSTYLVHPQVVKFLQQIKADLGIP